MKRYNEQDRIFYQKLDDTVSFVVFFLCFWLGVALVMCLIVGLSWLFS